MIEIRKRHTPKAREDRCSCMASDGLGFWGRESLSVQWDEAVLLLLGLRMKIVGLLAVTPPYRTGMSVRVVALECMGPLCRF